MSKKRIKPNYHRRVHGIRSHGSLQVGRAPAVSARLPHAEVYEYAIDQFTAWYCSEPRLAFNRIVVVRYRSTWSPRVVGQQTSQDGSLC